MPKIICGKQVKSPQASEQSIRIMHINFFHFIFLLAGSIVSGLASYSFMMLLKKPIPVGWWPVGWPGGWPGGRPGWWLAG